MRAFARFFLSSTRRSASMPKQLGTVSAVVPPGNRTVVRDTATDRLGINLDFSRISSSSTTHPHVLFSPMHYEPGYAYPLFVWLHGNGTNECQLTRLMPLLSMRNYVAVATQGIAVTVPAPRGTAEELDSLDVMDMINSGMRSRVQYDWPQNEEAVSVAEQRVFDCISVARQKNNIAEDRIFLAGFGNGGTMALRLGLLYPESFAGVVSIGGSFPSGHLPFRQWNAVRNLPVLLAVGEKSTFFSPADACGALELFHAAGLPTVIREYPCGQEIAPAMRQDVNRWIMEQVCGE